jgi:hypothetical protein
MINQEDTQKKILIVRQILKSYTQNVEISIKNLDDLERALISIGI